MTDKLTEICDTTRAEVARRKAASSLADLAARAATQSAARGSRPPCAPAPPAALP
jgi:indole-3-glycerol phosphate synthase